MFAWGMIGGEIIYDYNRSGPYYRFYREPYDPRTPLQLAQRSAFSTAAAAWEAESPAVKAWWEKRARPRRMTGKNLYMRALL
jgi:hypothetical protein